MADDLPELPNGFIHMQTKDHAFTLHGGPWTLQFEPGVPVPVHYSLQARALAHGAKPLGDQKAQTDQNPKPDLMKDPSSPEYRGAVRAAAETLMLNNDPEDFGANGKPYVSAWERELGWKPIESVREEIWDEVKAELAS